MKLFQLNFFGILILLLSIVLLVGVPSFLIQAVWNSTCATSMERDLSIDLWQAALLWGALVAALYMTGIFQFKLDFKTIDSIDLDAINDPNLKEEIEQLKLKAAKAKSEKPKHPKTKSKDSEDFRI